MRMPPQQSEFFTAHTVLPPLRPDLIISPQRFHGHTNYVIKDPVALRYYRIGQQELYLAGLLNGQRTLADVTEQMQKRFPEAEFDEDKVVSILTYFVKLSFFHLSGAQGQQLFATMLEAERKEKRKRGAMTVLSSVFYYQLPLCDPDKWLTKIEKKIRFVWTRKAMGVLLGLLLLALCLVALDRERFITKLPDFLTLNNLFLMWLTLIVVKVVHEFGHGLTCKHFGGEIHEMGAVLIVMTPLLYCNATDAWMFPDKWKKIYVTAAGIVVELGLASLATIVWVFTQPGVINQLAFNVMLVCSVSTVLFNANPLLRYDGYYAVADWLEVPNLRERARQGVLGFVEKAFTGETTPMFKAFSPRARILFPLYAVASYLYMWFVMYRISRMTQIKLEPIGLSAVGGTMAVTSFFVGAVVPVIMLGRQISIKLRTDLRGFVLARLAVAGICIGFVLLVLALVPWKLRVTSSCVLDGGNRVSVRPETAGFVRIIRVKEGDLVQSNQVLAVLENKDVSDQLADIRDRLQIAELLRHRATVTNDAVMVQQVNAETAKLVVQEAKLRHDVDALNVRTPINGVVLTADLDLKLNAYLHEGELLTEVLPIDRVRVVVSLSEREAGLVREDQPVRFRIYSLPSKVFSGEVSKTFMEDSSQLPHPAFSSKSGGDVPTTTEPNGGEKPSQRLYQAELLINNTERLLRPGMSGRAKISCGWSTPLRIIVSRLKEIIRTDILA
jgi:putative peptide zinc metalloprotease protein